MVKKLSEQVEEYVADTQKTKQEPAPIDTDRMISTGSTLLDLAISGGAVYGGGLPRGILVEIFGPPGCGKTVLLCEIAGAIRRQGGQVLFRDPEARLDRRFASLFGFELSEADYAAPNTVPEVFRPVREWNPEAEDEATIHGVFADSLAALSTNMEMEDKDTFGGRRAKEFSEELRKTCRIIRDQGYLMICSNQVRENIGAGPYQQKYYSPGGNAIPHYASLRLRCGSPTKIKLKQKVRQAELTRVVGVQTEIEVHKSSIWKPYRKAPLTVLYDYGVDDVRENLTYIKQITGRTIYTAGMDPESDSLGRAMNDAVHEVEKQGLEQQLKETVIALWQEAESKFATGREPKRRGSNG